MTAGEGRAAATGDGVERQKIVALLGRRDVPTDAVEEYWQYLGEALRAHGFETAISRVSWNEGGWASALDELRRAAKDWEGRWVCAQYTALGWSRRGFPLRFLAVLNILRKAGARIAVVYHDAIPYPGSRMLDRVRRAVQLRVMRGALRRAELGIFTVPLSAVTWIRTPAGHAVFIPVGANLPVEGDTATKAAGGNLRVAVFGVTGGDENRRECARIAEAIRFAVSRVGKLELHVFGRHAHDSETMLREELRDVPVEIDVKGVLPAAEVVRELKAAEVMLFVRGAISTRRGSAIAGVACGLPVVAQRGAETAGPIEEAGVVFVASDQGLEFGEALVSVLTNEKYRRQLTEKSRMAQNKYFSWAAIAARYAEELRKPR